VFYVVLRKWSGEELRGHNEKSFSEEVEVCHAHI
jgi:hypothetical protein